jgi:hypothetical protein
MLQMLREATRANNANMHGFFGKSCLLRRNWSLKVEYLPLKLLSKMFSETITVLLLFGRIHLE